MASLHNDLILNMTCGICIRSNMCKRLFYILQHHIQHWMHTYHCNYHTPLGYCVYSRHVSCIDGTNLLLLYKNNAPRYMFFSLVGAKHYLLMFAPENKLFRKLIHNEHNINHEKTYFIRSHLHKNLCQRSSKKVWLAHQFYCTFR